MINNRRFIAFLAAVALLLCGCTVSIENAPTYSQSVQNVPKFQDSPYAVVNNNQPEFAETDLTETAYEYYSQLDSLGRCGYAMACIGQELMPTEERGSIGQVKPSGWQTVKYDFVDGKYLYNRCHLIGYQLTAENANERNLITGTRYMNVQGMLPFENMVADYIKETGNHVLYRVTPVFEGDELVARGVQLEGYSVEDRGEGICFNVYVYNNQPGVVIDYATGKSSAAQENTSSGTAEYVCNTNSKKFHLPNCQSVQDMSEKNRQAYTGEREDLIEQGYTPCGSCDP